MTMLKILELAEDAALQRWDAARRDRIKDPTEFHKKMRGTFVCKVEDHILWNRVQKLSLCLNGIGECLAGYVYIPFVCNNGRKLGTAWS